MELYTSAGAIPHRGTGNLVAIGKWDGVHLGHQAIISELVGEARQTGGQAVVMGFHPHPMAVLRPESAPAILQTLEERAEMLSLLGVDVHLAIPFDHSFAGMAPEAFVQDVLVRDLNARKVVVGFNFTFGRGGQGTVETLRTLCAPHGITVEVMSPVREDGESVSSSEVRLHVAAGSMERATVLLGRPFSVTGIVEHGDKRGRTIGYPTANLRLTPGRQLPAIGVYVCRVTILQQPSPCTGPLPWKVAPRTGPTYSGMLNLGWRPTFQGKDLRCEANLFDFEGDLYGAELRVDFLHRLRGEQPFQGVEALVRQLQADEAAAREYVMHHGDGTAR
ncbi:MAG TPA: bifunctional riboflavin kinase/FAD synthetase [Symbiobacteriaceae bacterium]|nr:bifunctional riboflavin kinase/FAD synthetase [Symbiobacteriaceae bacterium]